MESKQINSGKRMTGSVGEQFLLRNFGYSDKSLTGVPDFDGATYEPEHDHIRLGAQLQRVKTAMLDGQWRTLAEIQEVTGDQLQAISARLRDFRKSKFGGHTVNRRRRGNPHLGFFEYQLELREA